jgi:hypothetical protein
MYFEIGEKIKNEATRQWSHTYRSNPKAEVGLKYTICSKSKYGSYNNKKKSQI